MTVTLDLDDDVYDKLCTKLTMDEIHAHLRDTAEYLAWKPSDEQMEEDARQKAQWEEENPDAYLNDYPDAPVIRVAPRPGGYDTLTGTPEG